MKKIKLLIISLPFFIFGSILTAVEIIFTSKANADVPYSYETSYQESAYQPPAFSGESAGWSGGSGSQGDTSC